MAGTAVGRLPIDIAAGRPVFTPARRHRLTITTTIQKFQETFICRVAVNASKSTHHPQCAARAYEKIPLPLRP